jgi:hypothetical protein
LRSSFFPYASWVLCTNSLNNDICVISELYMNAPSLNSLAMSLM